MVITANIASSSCRFMRNKFTPVNFLSARFAHSLTAFGTAISKLASLIPLSVFLFATKRVAPTSVRRPELAI